MTDPTKPPPDRGAILGRDYWLVWSTPLESTTQAEVEQYVDEHIAWLLKLETSGQVFVSGPVTSGPGVRPGTGVTVLRADSAEQALEIAQGDPFVTAGLRTVEVFGWRLNEGAVRLDVSLGTGTYTWF